MINRVIHMVLVRKHDDGTITEPNSATVSEGGV